MSEMDSMVSMYVLENSQLLEQLEELLLGGEKNEGLSKEQIDETFRVMHTIKGSSAMMEYNDVATLAHAVEDLFSKIRETNPPESEWERIFDIVLESIDFFKEEIEKIQDGNAPDGDPQKLCSELAELRKRLEGEEGIGEPATPAQDDDAKQAQGLNDIARSLLGNLKALPGDKKFWAKILFEKGCQMETIRADSIKMSIKDLYSSILTWPEDLETEHDAEIAENGFWMAFSTPEEYEEIIKQKVEETMLVESVLFGEEDEAAAPAATADLKQQEAEKEPADERGEDTAQKEPAPQKEPSGDNKGKKKQGKDDKTVKQSFISVNVNKIDKLMNLVGEIVTTESMVTKNSDLADLHLENFEKQARQLRKLTDELQDIVMSIRMVPVAATFHKMQRIVRDIGKKTNKEAELVIIGEDTEVDKNIIDNLSDPLMHLIRNAMDHGIETPEERSAAGKDPRGKITLEANSTSGDIIVRVMDDGIGMDRAKIIQKAYEKGLTSKPENEITDKEAYGFTLLPGFSTNDAVTEYSGRGVGMDVVHKNLEKIGGSITVDSEHGKGTTITMHIPLTLAIMDGMKVTVGKSTYIIPTLAIRESLEPRLHEIVTEPNGNEMIIIRGVCYPIVRLHKVFHVQGSEDNLKRGIMVLVDSEVGEACLFADKLLGEQQAVVKPMPLYVSKTIGRIKGISGCTIMGDGEIALILDINNLLA